MNHLSKWLGISLVSGCAVGRRDHGAGRRRPRQRAAQGEAGQHGAAGHRASRRAAATCPSTRSKPMRWHRAWRRLRRARSRRHQGRPPDRAPRADARTARPTCRRCRSSPAARRTKMLDGVQHDRLVRQRLHARRDQAAARHPAGGRSRPVVQRRFEIPTLRRGARPGAAQVGARRAARSASIRRPSIRRSTRRSACRSRTGCSTNCTRAGRNRRDAPVFIQSFEVVEPAVPAHAHRVELVQLIDGDSVDPDGIAHAGAALRQALRLRGAQRSAHLSTTC